MQHLLRTVPGLLNAIYEISDIICLFGRNPCFLGLFFEFQSSKFAKSGSIQCSVPPSGLSEHHCITSNLELERFLWSHPSAPTKFKSRNLFEESACQKGPKAENSETMCKADSASKPTVTETGQENCTFREISSAEVDDKDHREVVKKHEANGVVIFGAFVAGSLVGIIIAAPVIVVLLLGAGVAALTRSSSKAGKVARQVGKVSSDVLLIIFRKWREMNNKYRITDKMADAAKRAASKVKEADRKRGITKSIRDKASALWREIDQRTRVAPPQAQVLEAAPSVKESVAVTDGTAIPFDGRMETGGAYAVDHASVSKSFNA